MLHKYKQACKESQPNLRACNHFLNSTQIKPSFHHKGNLTQLRLQQNHLTPSIGYFHGEGVVSAFSSPGAALTAMGELSFNKQVLEMWGSAATRMTNIHRAPVHASGSFPAELHAQLGPIIAHRYYLGCWCLWPAKRLSTNAHNSACEQLHRGPGRCV